MKNTCSKQWNPHGTGLLYEDFPFPIFYIDDDIELTKIKNCFEKFNNFTFSEHKDRSLCSLELNSFMIATSNSPTCIRRTASVKTFNPVRFCDALGDENIWSSLFPIANTSEITLKNNMNYIILAARADTTSLFFDVKQGAESPVTGIVTLLTTAKLLKKMLPDYDKYSKFN